MSNALFNRNLNRYGQDVTIQTRAQSFRNGAPVEAFTEVATVPAIIKTLTGVSIFDQTNTERVATHRFCIAYRDDVTAENWVYFGTKRIKILYVENYCEADEQLRLFCSERGEDSRVVNEG